MATSANDKLQRTYLWNSYKDTGFPNVVNHAAATYIDEKSGEASVYSIGGFTGKAPGSPFRSVGINVHKFDVVSRTWNSVKTRSNKDDPALAPCAACRYGHSVCVYNGRIYIFGGTNDDEESMKDVHCFVIATSAWINCQTSGRTPEARDGHACTRIDSTMFTHGGYSSVTNRFDNSLYGLNLETLIWEQYPCNGVYITQRDFHTATSIGKHKIIIFGGRCDENAPVFTGKILYDQTFYCYDLRDGKWSKVITTGYKPIGRRSHTAVHCRESVIYFGGFNSIINEHFADIFMLNVTTNHITEVRPWGEYPCSRRRSACALAGSELIICGGGGPMPNAERKCNKPVLVSHSDTYVLNLLPTLQELCLSLILTNGIDYSILPWHLHSYLAELSSIDIKRNENERTMFS